MPRRGYLPSLTVLAPLAVGGCLLLDPEDRERVAPPPRPTTPAQLLISDTLARTPDGCAAVNVVLTATTLSAAFPSEAHCGSGVILRPAGPHAIVRDTTHWRVSLRVAWRNNTGSALVGSRRLILAPDSGIVLQPVSSYGTDPVAVNHDGTVAGGHPLAGAAFWTVGGGTTPNGSLTPDTVVTVDVPVGTGHFLLRFGGDSLAPPVGRPPVPDGWWAPDDSTLAVENTDSYGYSTVFRMFVGIDFSSTATPSEVRAALASHDAVVVGGLKSLMGPGSYVVQVPDPGSFAGLKAVMGSFRGTAGVSDVSMSYHDQDIGPRSRFPVDDSGLERWSWNDTSVSALSAWRAIGASQAWGCENGLYGSSISVAALDLSFDRSHPDLSSLVIHDVIPEANLWYHRLRGTSDTARNLRSHGNAVIGGVVAIGDNGTGIAGALWSANVNLFNLAVDSLVARNLHQYFRTYVGPHLIGISQPRLLVSSTVIPGDSLLASAYREAIGGWLAADAKRLFVYALPNVGTASATTVASAGTALPASDVAAAQLAALYPGQVLFVTASDHTQGTLVGGVWTGVPVLAAPGVNVLTLARSDEFTGGRKLSTGTSHAAPLVAGAAAQLMAMAPNLTADSVIHYLLAGASAPRYDPWVDSLVTPVPLTGTSLYQLHSFATLQLYSRTHADAPICGLEVSVDGNAGEVTIHRSTPTVLSFPNFYIDHFVSVAQGGRLLSLASWDEFDEPLAREYRLAGGSWQAGATLPGVEQRYYLEADTLDVFLHCPDECGPKLTLRSGGTAQVRDIPNITAITEGAGTFGLDGLSVAPTGDWATLWINGRFGWDSVFQKQVLLNLRTGGVTSLVRTQGPYAPEPYGSGATVPDSLMVYATWTRTGDRVTAAWHGATIYYPVPDGVEMASEWTRFFNISVTTGTPAVTSSVQVTDRVPIYRRWTSHDDRVHVAVEGPPLGGAALRVRRNLAQLGTVLGTSSFTYPHDLYRDYYPTGQIREDPNPKRKWARDLNLRRSDLATYRRQWRIRARQPSVIP